MKKENITVSFDGEKLRATKKYLRKKNLSLEQTLEGSMQKLYEKYVPPQVREYIDESLDEQNKARK